MDIKDGKNEFSFQLTSSPDSKERRAAPSQLSVVSVHLCVSLVEELLGLEAGCIWTSGTERTKCTQGSGKEQVSLTERLCGVPGLQAAVGKACQDFASLAKFVGCVGATVRSCV